MKQSTEAHGSPGAQGRPGRAHPDLCFQDKVIIGLAFDCVDKTVYWTDISEPSIGRASLLGGEPTTIIRQGGCGRACLLLSGRRSQGMVMFEGLGLRRSLRSAPRIPPPTRSTSAGIVARLRRMKPKWGKRVLFSEAVWPVLTSSDGQPQPFSWDTHFARWLLSVESVLRGSARCVLREGLPPAAGARTTPVEGHKHTGQHCP